MRRFSFYGPVKEQAIYFTRVFKLLKVLYPGCDVIDMSRKFYKLLIIGNPQLTILHIPNRNNGIMECWNNDLNRWNQENNCSQLPSFPLFAAGVYLPEGRHPIIPLFHHSIIPIVSAAN